MGDYEQFNTNARAIAAASPQKEALLGATAVEKAQVAQWLSFVASTGDLDEHLASLDGALGARAFFVGDALSLADLSLYWQIHPLLAARAAKEDGGSTAGVAKQLPCLCRWFDQVQHMKGVEGAPEGLAQLAFDTTTRMQLPPLSAVLKAVAMKAAAGGGGGGGGGGKAAAAPAATKGGKGGDASGGGGSGGGGGGSGSGGAAKGGKDKKAEKAAKKAAKPAKAGAPAAAADTSSPVSKLDIRVGLIVKAWKHETADKLFCEEIDVGEEKPRNIASGLQGFVTEAELQSRPCLVLCNMKPRNMVGFPSQGMVLCAINADHSAVELVDPPAGAKVGERVTFEGCDGDAASPAQLQKKKLLEAALPGLKVDAAGGATYNGVPFMTSAGPCTAKSIRDGHVN